MYGNNYAIIYVQKSLAQRLVSVELCAVQRQSYSLQLLESFDNGSLKEEFTKFLKQQLTKNLLC